MKKLKIIILSVALPLLIMSICLQVIPSNAFATEIPAEQVQTIGEIEFLRETNSETYLLSNGTYERVIYAYDKYYCDINDTLRLIDNSLILDESSAATTGLRYKNRANHFEVTFSDAATPTITMTQDGQKLTFSAERVSGGNPFHTTADQQAVRLGAVNDCRTLGTIAETGDNTITYANAFYNTDIVYTLHNHALKEYIILKNNHAPNEITFLFSTEGLTLEQSGNTAVFLDNKGAEVFALGQLFAIDANGAYTDDLTYTFTPVKGTNNTLVTVTLDQAYLDAADRAFPVVIDPTLEISSTKNPDASVYSAHPDTNYKYDNRLRTGKESSYGKSRSYIAFALPSDIDDTQIIEATLSLRKYSGQAPNARAYRCESSWSSGTITWNNMPSYTVANISSESVPRSSGSSWYEMDVTDMVVYWLENPSKNYGFVVRDNQESDTTHWTSFYSCDGTSSRIPELHITYDGEEIALSLPTSRSGSISAGGEKIYKYTPTVSTTYSVWTTGSTNTIIRVYYSYLSESPLVTATGGGHGTNACATLSLNAKTRYYFVVSGNSSSTSGSFTLKFQRGLPMSGSEQPDYSNAFNGYWQYTNCYAYMIACLANPKDGSNFLSGGPHPGMIAWDAMRIDYTSLETAKTSIVMSVQADCNAWGGNGTTDFYEVDADTMVPTGYYKVALGINLDGGDYHWYRQYSGGVGRWAHKMGTSQVSTIDDKDLDIYDPATAEVGEYEFVGYFALKPPSTELVIPAKADIPTQSDSIPIVEERQDDLRAGT